MTTSLHDASWRRFALCFAAAAFGLTAALYGFTLAFDPFGIRASPERAPTPLMDVNQRFMYPQIVRGGGFDSAVFGTSTIRLLNPERLDRLFGGKFANLAMNAATPWEQTQLIELFLRRHPQPRNLIFSLDETWCEADADSNKLTFRAFPPWLYDDNPLNDYPELLNLTTLEIAGRVALNRLGLMPERISHNGYEVFVPDEALYDLSKARQNIKTMRDLRLKSSALVEVPGEAVAPRKPRRANPRRASAGKFPALAWLDDILSRVPATTSVTLTFMPIHASVLPDPASEPGRTEAACKARVAELGSRHNATVVDFRRRSPVTAEDSNYWDAMHYRVGIADMIADGLAAARTSQRGDDRGFYAVLSPRPQ